MWEEVLQDGNVERTQPFGLVSRRPERSLRSQQAMPKKARLVKAIAAAAVGVTISAGVQGQDRTDLQITVSADRLLNAQNELQNWLMENRDYAATRYSKLTQINRDTVKKLRMAWALALGGMADVGQNGPENETNPLVDNGFMYTSDGWGTVYKIDARNPDKGSFVWVTDPGVPHRGHNPRTRGVALWEDLVISNLVDGRVVAMSRDNGKILWDKQVGVADEFGNKEGFVAAPMALDRKVIVANSAGARGWIAALDARTGQELWRWYVVPGPGEPGHETWKDDHNAWKTGGGRIWQTGSYDPLSRLLIYGTGNPIPAYDPEARPGDNLYTASVVALSVDTGKLAWYFQYTPNDSWDYDEVGSHILFDGEVNGTERKLLGHFGRNGFFYTIDRSNGAFVGGVKYVNELNWTGGLDPATGKPVEYDPHRDVQIYRPQARALRGQPAARACPTWHGGVAHQPAAYNPVKRLAYGVGAEGCFSTAAGVTAYLSPQGGIDRRKTPEERLVSDLYYGGITACDVVAQRIRAKAVTEIEVRSGALATAGGLVFTALQDGWVVAYNDETLEELWRFNVGTPLKGAPMTYAIGPRQYLAVQASGRHVHPVKFDDLQTSSYLFVFALD
jgi:alcohol dehydrogenase (cytochrome c)